MGLVVPEGQGREAFGCRMVCVRQRRGSKRSSVVQYSIPSFGPWRQRAVDWARQRT